MTEPEAVLWIAGAKSVIPSTQTGYISLILANLLPIRHNPGSRILNPFGLLIALRGDCLHCYSLGLGNLTDRLCTYSCTAVVCFCPSALTSPQPCSEPALWL